VSVGDAKFLRERKVGAISACVVPTSVRLLADGGALSAQERETYWIADPIETMVLLGTLVSMVSNITKAL